jgi:hypothetical protein
MVSENSPKPEKLEDDELVRDLLASGASASKISKKLVRAEAATKARTEYELSVNKITEHNAEVRVRRTATSPSAMLWLPSAAKKSRGSSNCDPFPPLIGQQT